MYKYEMDIDRIDKDTNKQELTTEEMVTIISSIFNQYNIHTYNLYDSYKGHVENNKIVTEPTILIELIVKKAIDKDILNKIKSELLIQFNMEDIFLLEYHGKSFRRRHKHWTWQDSILLINY